MLKRVGWRVDKDCVERVWRRQGLKVPQKHAGAKTLYIKPGSPWENGYCESFRSKLRDEFLNGRIFYSIKELRMLIKCWRVHHNTHQTTLLDRLQTTST